MTLQDILAVVDTHTTTIWIQNRKENFVLCIEGDDPIDDDLWELPIIDMAGFNDDILLTADI